MVKKRIPRRTGSNATRWPPPGRRNPTHTALVPSELLNTALLPALIEAQCTFTCEPGIGGADVWHVGLLAEGVAVLQATLGPVRGVGTLGDLS